MALSYKDFRKKLRENAYKNGDPAYNDYNDDGEYTDGNLTVDGLKAAIQRNQERQDMINRRLQEQTEKERAYNDYVRQQEAAAQSANDADDKQKNVARTPMNGGASTSLGSALASDILHERESKKAKTDFTDAQKQIDKAQGTNTSASDTEEAFNKYRQYLRVKPEIEAQEKAEQAQKKEKSADDYAEQKLDELTPEQQSLMRTYVNNMPGLTASDYQFKFGREAAEENQKEIAGVKKARQAKSILNQQGIKGDAFSKYMEYTQRLQNKQDRENYQNKIKDETHTGDQKKDVMNSIGRSVESVAQSVFGGPMSAIGALEHPKDKHLTVDTNGPHYAASNQAQDTREIIANNIENGGGGKIGSLAYQSGMSIADSAAYMAMGGAAGAAAGALGAGAGAAEAAANVGSLAPIAMSSFGTSFQDAKQRGLSDAQAYGLATVNGAAEVLTEKVSLDNFWDIAKKQGRAATRGALMNVLASTGIEGSEEVASDFIDEAADRIISGNKSDYENNVRAYQQNGLSEKEARKRATADFFGQVGADFLGGAAGGLVFGTGALAANARNFHIAGQTNSEDIRNIGNRYAPESTRYETPEQNENASRLHAQAEDIANRMDQGKRVSKYERANLLSNAAQADLDSSRTLANSMTADDLKAVYEGIDTNPNSYLNAKAQKAAENTKAQAKNLMDRMSSGETVPENERLNLVMNVQNVIQNASEASRAQTSKAADRTSYRQIQEADVPEEYRSRHLNSEEGMSAISGAKTPTELAAAYHESVQDGTLPEDLSRVYGLKREGMIRSGQTTAQEMNQLEQAETPAQAYLHGFNTNESNRYSGRAQEAFNAGRIARNNEAGAQAVSAQGLAGNFTVQDEDGSSYTFNPRSIVSGEDNVISIKTENGTVPLNRLSSQNVSVQTLINNMAAQDNPETAKSFIDTYQRVTGAYEKKNGRAYPIRTYASMFDTVNMLGQIYGSDDKAVNHVSDMRDMGYISSTLGKENIKAIMQSATPDMETMTAGRGAGTVTIDNHDFDMTDDEKQVEQLVSYLADLTKTNVHLTRGGDSIEQGSYNAKGEVRLNLDSSNLFSTISHEMIGEYSLTNAPEAYHAAERAWADEMIHRMGLNRFSERVRTYQKAYRTSGIKSEQGKTYNQALDEYFNDNLGFVLFSSDGNIRDFYDRMEKQEGKKQTNSFFSKVADFLENVKRAFQNFLENHHLTKEQEESVQIGLDRTNHVYDLVTKMLGEARENNRKQAESVSEEGAANEKQVKDFLDSAKPVKRFSISAPVEEKGDLIAVHNLTEEELNESLNNFGGVVAPSVAIIRAGMGHDKYGKVSVVLRRDSIDPKSSRYNRLYSSDAWTPTFPHISYEANEKKIKEFNKEIDTLVPADVQAAIGKPNTYQEEVESKLGSNKGSFSAAYGNNKVFQYAYLADMGKKITIPHMEARLSNYYPNEVVRYIAQNYSDEELAKAKKNGEKWAKEHVNEVQTLLGTLYKENHEAPTDDAPKFRKIIYEEGIHPKIDEFKVEELIDGAYKLKTEGVKQRVDGRALEEEIDKNIPSKKDFEKWLDEKTEGIIKNSGIRNEKDSHTPYGNARSFKSLHYDVTADNVLKVMRKENETGNDGAAGFFKFVAASQKKLNKVSDIKADESRLRMIPDNQMEEIKNDLSSEFTKIAESITKKGNLYSDLEAMDVLSDSVKNKATLSTVRSRLEGNSKYINIQPDTARRTFDLAEKIRSLPTGYFEAKPMRLVGTDEFAMVIIPDNAEKNTKDNLTGLGIPYETYKAGDKEDRKAKLNSVPDVRFSLQVKTEPYAYDYSRYSVDDFDPLSAFIDDDTSGAESYKDYQGNKEFLTSSLENAANALKGKWKVSDPAIDTIANYIIKKYSSSYSAKELSGSLKSLFDYMDGPEKVNYEQMMDLLMDSARSVVDQAAVDPAEQEKYDNFRRDIRYHRLKLTDAQRKEVEYQYGSWKEFFGESAGIFRQDKENGEKLDDGAFLEIVDLAREYGIMIDPETAEPDQPRAILDAVDSLEPQPKNIFVEQGANLEELSMDVASDILDKYFGAAADAMKQNARLESVSGTQAMREAKSTIEKAKADLEKRENEYRAKVKKNFQARTKELRDELKKQQEDYNKLAAVGKGWHDKLKAVSDENLRLQAQAKARVEKGSVQEYIDAKNREKYRKNIRQTGNRLLRWLNQPTNSQHIPDKVAGDIANLVDSIDWVGDEVTAYQGKDTDPRNKAWKARVLLGHDEKGKPKYQYFESDTKKGAEDKANVFIIETWPEGRTKTAQKWRYNLRTLHDRIQALQNGQIASENDEDDVLGDVLANTFDQDILQQMTDLIDSTEHLTVRKLSADQLKQLSQIMDSVSAWINRANKLYSNQHYKTVEALANETISYTSENLKSAPNKEVKGLNAVKTFLNVDQLEPVTWFDTLGPSGESLYRAFRDGQDVRTQHLKEAMDAFPKMLEEAGISKKELRDLSGDRSVLHRFGDQTYTTAQLMSLYVLVDREQALNQHIIPGGIVPDRIQRGVLTYNTNSIRPRLLSKEQWKAMTDVLTPEQKKLAKLMRNFLSGPVASWGNHASKEMYGYSKFTEKNYFPIKVYSASVDSSDRTENRANGNTSLYAVVNMSSSKNLNKHAKNALVVQDIFDVFTDHINQMATYDGYALPILDSMKWFNYRVTEKPSEENNFTARQGDSIKSELSRIGGDQFQKYFLTFLKDVNGANETDESASASAVNAIVGAYKGAAIGGNLRVVIQQPTAYARASAEISDKYLLKALGSIAQAEKYSEKAKKYSMIALWKSWGFYETNIGPSVKAMITGIQNTRENINEKSNYLAGKADDLTWGMLWRAAELEVQDKRPELSYDSEEFLKAVGLRFSDIIEKTQVVDSVMTKSQIMRRKGFLSKTLTAFMAEPTKSYNMLFRGLKAGKKPFLKAVKAYIFNAILTALAASVMDAMRDRDKKFGADGWLQSYISAFRENALDGLNPLETIPIFKDLWDTIDNSLIKPAFGESSYTSGSSMYSEGANNIVNSVKDFIKIAQGNSKKTPYGIVRSAVRGLSQISGIPAYNLWRDFVEAPVTTLIPGASDALRTSEASTYEKLYDAVDSGKNIVSEVQKVKDKKIEEAGSKKEGEKKAKADISAALTRKYKDTLIEYYKTNKTKAAELKRDLLKAYQAAGYDRSDANEKINKWVEE